jgi:lipoprotein-anchoring transpeptidase ErfK/SrfK
VTITPADGVKKARPDQGIQVTVAKGTLQTVNVTAKGATVPGTLSADKTSWKSAWTLKPGTAYQATATAAGGDGKTTTTNASFRTLSSANPLAIQYILPGTGSTVGIGMPVIVQFNKSVQNKAAVERSLVIKSAKPVTGAWFWYSSTQVIFRTKNGTYWPANQKVTVTAHLAGVKSGASYGAADVSHTFKIGDAHIITASAITHKLTVKDNGKVVRTWGVSMGRGGDVEKDGADHLLTTSGIHLVMGHSRVEHMVSPGKKPGDPGYYAEDVPWASRISNSGEFIHQSMGDLGCLGRSNCSHGCVRSPAADAQWFFKWSYLGDVVKITGTKRKLIWWNGWGYYQMPWATWVKGGALDKEIQT